MEPETGRQEEEYKVDEEGGGGYHVNNKDHEEEGAGDHGVPEQGSHPLGYRGDHMHQVTGALRLGLVVRPPVLTLELNSCSRYSRILRVVLAIPMGVSFITMFLII